MSVCVCVGVCVCVPGEESKKVAVLSGITLGRPHLLQAIMCVSGGLWKKGGGCAERHNLRLLRPDAPPRNVSGSPPASTSAVAHPAFHPGPPFGSRHARSYRRHAHSPDR